MIAPPPLKRHSMGSGIPVFDIIILALIAAFVILRLRSVLGKRTGHQCRPAEPFRSGPERNGGTNRAGRGKKAGRRKGELRGVASPAARARGSPRIPRSVPA